MKKQKSPFLLYNPRLSPAQRKRFKSLRDTVVGGLDAAAAQSAVLVRLNKDIDKLHVDISALETSGDTSATAAQKLSTLRTQAELLAKKLAEAERAAAAPRTDQVSQERLEAFEALSRELADFFADYVQAKIEEFGAILTPLFTDGNSVDPAGRSVNGNYIVTRIEPRKSPIVNRKSQKPLRTAHSR